MPFTVAAIGAGVTAAAGIAGGIMQKNAVDKGASAGQRCAQSGRHHCHQPALAVGHDRAAGERGPGGSAGAERAACGRRGDGEVPAVARLPVAIGRGLASGGRWGCLTGHLAQWRHDQG